MARIRTLTEIIKNWEQYVRGQQPLATINPGSVIKDILIDAPSFQLSQLYEELSQYKQSSSLLNAVGTDLDRWLKSFDFARPTAKKATGPALLTFNDLSIDIGIRRGDVIFAKNGASFVVQNSLTLTSLNANSYRATAARYRADLDFLNISDQYAVEVLVECSTTGTQGNISKYGLARTNIVGISNVTNTSPFSGGTTATDDATTKQSFIAAINGANGATSTGYRNAVLTDPGVLDALVVEPGDYLMTRDGTVTAIDPSTGETVIVQEGTGGKFDILILGNRLQSTTDSFLYQDKSNAEDPTATINNVVLGQKDNANKTVLRRRYEDLNEGVLPEQPVFNIVRVTGSSSGPNFQPKTVDNLGRITGNFELLKDTGFYAGSPWAFDALHWIDDRIRGFVEDKTKGILNGQDALSFTDVTLIPTITQNISITNENSAVNPSNRSSVTLLHTPATAVTRVLNLTTGERYTVTAQNPDNPSSSLNTTGRITIAGKSLPATNDILQVDYTWVYSFDSYFDYDNRSETSRNARSVVDSVDWGYANLIRREPSTLYLNGSILSCDVVHPISNVLKVTTVIDETGDVSLVSGRFAVVVANEIENVVSIIRNSDGAELWTTSSNDGTYRAFTIFLPTDSLGEIGDSVTVVYNETDYFNPSSSEIGSFNNQTITLPASVALSAGTSVECTYLANISVLADNILLSDLPLLRNNNRFSTNTLTEVGYQPVTYLIENAEIVQNLRTGPSSLGLTLTGSFSPGTFTISGTSILSAMNVIITASNNGLEQNLSSAIRSALGINSITSIPNTVGIARVVSVKKVETNDNLEVLETLHEFDVIPGYQIANNFLVLNEAVQNTSLSATEFVLPATQENENNAPQIGDRLQISFHIYKSSDSENVFFSRTGTQYTQKRFAWIDSLHISSGFNSAASANAVLTLGSLNQPATKSRYKVTYDYLAPKQNERITVEYNYNRAVTDATLAIEPRRNPGDDVLVKAATPILVDVTLYVVVLQSVSEQNNAATVLQNVQDAVIRAINTNTLGAELDESDVVSAATSVAGVDRIRITFFNRNGNTGKVLTISAEKNEYLVANLISVNQESKS